MKWILDGFSPHPTNALVTRAYFCAVEDDGVTPIMEPKSGVPVRVLIEHDEFNESIVSEGIAAHTRGLLQRQSMSAKVATGRNYLQSIRGTPITPAVQNLARDQAIARANSLHQKKQIRSAVAKPKDPDLVAVQDELDALYKSDPTLFGLPAKQ